MSTIRLSDCLNDREWSPLWERYLANAAPFDPIRIQEISCLIPLPEQTGMLIFSENQTFFSELDALKILELYSAAHCFPNYQILANCLKDVGSFGQYKFPWICPFFALAPLEGKTQTIWLNPLKIFALKSIQGRYCVDLLDGPNLLLPVQRRSIITRAEIACLILATIRRGNFHFVIEGKIPSDYLTLPNTPFVNSLKNRKTLTRFYTSLGELNQLYQKLYSLHHCEELIDNPEAIDHIQWL